MGGVICETSRKGDGLQLFLSGGMSSYSWKVLTLVRPVTVAWSIEKLDVRRETEVAAGYYLFSLFLFMSFVFLFYLSGL